ncbi:MAG TPA: threonylcarbamoyl-AMP synthase, partial [Crocinitomicaceae bacterium]|nr:threonylcarbamoyl-AMP synthase [Crocinitomicaceae bacterium]
IILEIVKELGNPIATTSLHDSEDEIKDYFIDPYVIYERFDSEVDLIIDGGQGLLEVSTIVNCIDGVEIVRQGIGEMN